MLNEHETPQSNIKFDKSQTFDIKNKEKDFKLKISYNENAFLFEVEKIAEFPKNNYCNLLSFEELGKINKFFRQFDSPEEVINSLKVIVNNNNLKIFEEDRKMKIEITNPANQQTFSIDVPIKKKELGTEVSNLVTYVSSLKDRIVSLENKNKELEEQLKYKNEILEKELKNKYEILEKELKNTKEILEKELKNKYELMEKELKPIKEKYYRKQKMLEDIKESFKKSSIIQKEDAKIIMKWFEEKPTKFIKLLDSKIDGDTTNAFENKCAKKCPTMVFVKTIKGRRFGGFTTVTWTNGYSKDNKAFLFSLDRKEKYKITDENYANCLSSGNSFYFGGGTLTLYNNCTSKNDNFVTNSNFESVPENYGINGGEHKFTVSSYEVYQVEY